MVKIIQGTKIKGKLRVVGVFSWVAERRKETDQNGKGENGFLFFKKDD